MTKYTDEENFELTNYIKKSVQGIAPDTSEEVIHGAIKRYFTSKKEAVVRGTESSQSTVRRMTSWIFPIRSYEVKVGLYSQGVVHSQSRGHTRSRWDSTVRGSSQLRTLE
uniref:Uncharacterized protein n=1 Tax=Magallana gigas TaxID=29159 RepID=A0A8W8MNZ3_MAGGI